MPLYIPPPFYDYAGVYILPRNTDRTLEFYRTIQIVSDSHGLKLGASQDARIHYSGTNLVVDATLVAPSDILLASGAGKTTVFSDPPYEEIFQHWSSLYWEDRTDARVGSVGGERNRGLWMEDRGHIDTTWIMPHSWWADETVTFKIHWTTTSSGVTTPSWNCVTFGETLTDVESTFGGNATLNTADQEPSGAAQPYVHYVTVLDPWSVGRTHIRAGVFTSFECRLNDSDCCLLGITMLIKKDTIGSRTARNK